jgi:BirA family biotin operon repressor/biotin-[acetyl-CoA-carboxylase] ligase
LHWFPTLRSTNSHAGVLRERGTLYAPAVVLTGRQTAGRGRGSHAWWSTGGCLTVTFVLPVDDAIAPHQVPLLAGLATRRAAAAFVGDRVQLKWPNDLLVDHRKLAGLLCERMRKVDLVGIGLNVNLDPAAAPSDLQNRVTSLAYCSGSPVNLTDALLRLAAELKEVFHRLPERPFPALLQEYNEHHALTNRRVTILDAGDGRPVNGTVDGLDDMGRLLVRDRRTIHRIVSGQVVAR